MIQQGLKSTNSRLSSALARIAEEYPLERKLLVCARPAHGRELLRGLAQEGIAWAGFDIMTPQQLAHSVVAADIAVEDTQFWVVRVRADLGGISGFKTLVSGTYIGVNLGQSQKSRREFVGKRVADLYPQVPAIAEKHAAMDQLLWANPGGQSYEIPLTTRGGVSRDAIYYKATFGDASGEVAGLVGAIVDITGRKQAEAAVRESEERWRSIVDSANDGILVYDRSLNVVFANRAAERVLGLAALVVAGRVDAEGGHVPRPAGRAV